MSYCTLPIYFHTDDTSSLKELGIEYNLSDCQIREIDFFNIGAISDYIDDSIEEKLTSVFSNGFEFICVLNRKETLKKIIESGIC